MKNEKENENVDINERAICLNVKDDVIDKVRTGEITHISLDINDNNYRDILENIDGNLVLVVDEMPTTFHGCYYYNDGEFPYAVKGALEFLVLKGGGDYCLAKIIDIDTESGTRFRFQGSGEPSVEDPDGDSCIWEISFEVVPVPKEPRHYLMRWNPTISSFTEKDFEVCVENMERGMFRLDWSIFDWQEAKRGDFFYMMRTGDEQPGIVFNGLLLSDPYPMEDLTGNAERKMYVDVVCMNVSEPGETPQIPLRELQAAIPDFDWSKGHSGELLSEEITAQLDEM
jgi:hypothetical protein